MAVLDEAEGRPPDKEIATIAPTANNLAGNEVQPAARAMLSKLIGPGEDPLQVRVLSICNA